LFEAGCDWMSARGQPDHVAVHAADGQLTYQELDGLANQMARYLLTRGVGPGDRVGLLIDQGTDSYVAMLAVLKIQAVYVPMDLGFPADRVLHLTTEVGVRTVVSETSLAERLRVHPRGPQVQVLLMDVDALAISRHLTSRLDRNERGGPVSEVASLTYPTDPHARPHGVEFTHARLCKFAIAAAKLSGVSMDDRVYESVSAPSDYSVEAIWVAWIVGATLIPKAPGPGLSGAPLCRFLAAQRVTALYCTPRLLASVDEELPGLSLIVLSGSPCPSDLLTRWRRPGRRVVSVYGTTPSQPPTTAATKHLATAGPVSHMPSSAAPGRPVPGELTTRRDERTPVRTAAARPRPAHPAAPSAQTPPAVSSH
jgi:non-ribosomal peptide synthetase component F